MIIITGNVEITESHLGDALALCLKHVAQSRTEKGCISHNLTQDVGHPCKLFFFERWQDDASVQAHFALESSQQFVKRLSAMCVSAPVLEIFQSEQIK
jgi:quinol monooxygenase YgiN